MINNPLLVILGHTASGKTKLATSLALHLSAEIISADSRQIFKGMDIGTGKDLNEYTIKGRSIPYHLIDHKEAGERYQVDAYKEDFYKVFTSLTSKNILPILCGGTGMYIHSILQNHQYTSIPIDVNLRERLSDVSLLQLQQILLKYPASLTQHADQSTRKRLIRAIEIAEFLSCQNFDPPPKIEITPLVIGISMPVEERRKKIYDRLHSRMEEGLIEEVKHLLESGVSSKMLDFYGLEYRYINAYLSKELSYEQLINSLHTAICQYAKRQMTFFRKMEKDGVDIHWFNAHDLELNKKVLELVMDKWNIKGSTISR